MQTGTALLHMEHNLLVLFHGKGTGRIQQHSAGAKHPERIFRNSFLKRRIKSDAVFHIASDNCRIFPEHALSRTGGINQDFIEIFRETVCKVSRILGQDQGVFHTEQL